MLNKILNTTRKSSERYRLISGSQGCIGQPEHSPNHKYTVVCGTDRGNGYQGYYAISYILKSDHSWFPAQARYALIKKLSWAGYNKYLKEIGVL